MSSAETERRLPRFSLITLVVAVNVAAGLIAANLLFKRVYWTEMFRFEARPFSRGTLYQAEEFYGWPDPWHAGPGRLEEPSDPGHGLEWLTTEDIARKGLPVLQPSLPWQRPGIVRHWPGLIWNVAVAFVLVITAAALTEWTVRTYRKSDRHD